MINLGPRARSAILSEVANRPGPDETGGILLGHDHGVEIQVTLAGGPGSRSTHSPTRFRRDLAHAESLSLLAWDQDRSVWIGDWHTHPQGTCRPSRYDLSTYRRLLRCRDLDFERFLAIIVAPTGPDPDIQMAAWIATLRHPLLPAVALTRTSIRGEQRTDRP